ncbi:MAG: hypothetical protein V7L29_27340 [Nostoc sp.]|uniref:hypothetical protein n=1 Tax=Nostoc sp. TaxID=1180 RepID=UPI002FF7EA21
MPNQRLATRFHSLWVTQIQNPKFKIQNLLITPFYLGQEKIKTYKSDRLYELLP